MPDTLGGKHLGRLKPSNAIMNYSATLYLQHAVNGEILGRCPENHGTPRDNLDTTLDRYWLLQIMSLYGTVKEGFEANSCYPVKIMRFDVKKPFQIGQKPRKVKGHEYLCPIRDVIDYQEFYSLKLWER